VGHIARMGEMRNGYEIFVVKLEDLGVDCKIILE